MRLTPAQISELRSDRNVRGATLDGNKSMPLYLIAVGDVAMERAQQLTALGSVPLGLAWFVVASAPNRTTIHTTQPEWFAELEEQINDARRPQAPARW